MIEIETEGHHENWFTSTEIAKMLNLKDSNGKSIGRNKMYALLRENAILMNGNEPYQWTIALGLVQMYLKEKRGKTYYLPIFSIRCLNYVQKKIAEGKFVTKIPPVVNNYKDIDEVM